MHISGTGPLRSSPLDVARTTNRLQSDSDLPLLVDADIERGLASRLTDVPSFPWAMAFGAINDPDEVKHFAAVTAREARAVGIEWALAPVADVNSNPANPIINDRSFGEDPRRVSALVSSYILGARENGLLVTAKHFPGQGDSSIDSHRGVPSVDGDLEHLEKFEFLPFEGAIHAGVDSIMLAHARVPAVDPDPDRIATISSKTVTGILRGMLGFKGVILTDAMEMKGITSLYDPKRGSPTALASVDAVKAGCDVIMIPTDIDGAFHGIISAVQNGEIPESQINESVRRILAMKVSIGLDKSRLVNVAQAAELTGKAEDLAFAQKVADDAVTLVRNSGRMLPIRNNETANPTSDGHRRLVAILLAEALESTNGREFEKALASRRPDAHIFYLDNRTASMRGLEVLDAVSKADEVVVVGYLIHHGAREFVANGAPTTVFGLMGSSGHLLHEILSMASQKTIFVAMGSPYIIEGFPEIQNYICTYAMAATSEISAVKALFGELENEAKLPVTLPGVAPRGSSLPWPRPNLQQGGKSKALSPVRLE